MRSTCRRRDIAGRVANTKVEKRMRTSVSLGPGRRLARHSAARNPVAKVTMLEPMRLRTPWSVGGYTPSAYGAEMKLNRRKIKVIA